MKEKTVLSLITLLLLIPAAQAAAQPKQPKQPRGPSDPIVDIKGYPPAPLQVPAAVLWTYDLSTIQKSTWDMASGDLDNDGLMDVAIIPYDEVHAVFGDTGTAAWTLTPATGRNSAVAMGDLDGDGIDDVVVASHDYNVYAINGATGLSMWNYTCEDWVMDVAIGDIIPTEPGLEVAVGVDFYASTKDLIVLRGSDGAELRTYYTYDGDGCETVILEDLNGDGALDVITATYYIGDVYAWDANNNVLLWRSTSPSWTFLTDCLASGDLNDDGTPDIVYACYGDDRVWALNGADGSVLWSDTQDNGLVSRVWDVDNDGENEVVVGWDGLVTVYSRTGTLESQFTTGDWNMDLDIGEFDPSKHPGLEIAIASYDGRVYINSAEDISQCLYIHVAPPGGWYGSLEMGDVDGDGLDEVVAAGYPDMVCLENFTAVWQRVFQDDVESGAGAWTSSGLWHITTRRASSPTHSWWCGDEGTGEYTNNLNDTLTRRVNLIGYTYALLNFSTWYEIESGYDFGYVEVSTDGGYTWTTLASFTGTSRSGGKKLSKGAWTPSERQVWTTAFVDLSAYTGRVILIRFRFESDYSVTYEGWYVDDIGVFAGPPRPIPEYDGYGLALACLLAFGVAVAVLKRR